MPACIRIALRQSAMLMPWLAEFDQATIEDGNDEAAFNEATLDHG